MISATFPPMPLDPPAPRTGKLLLRWGLVAVAHGILFYGILHSSFDKATEASPLPANISVRLLPLQEPRKPELKPPPPPPRPAPAVPKAVPRQPEPILTAKPEAPSAAAVSAPAPAPSPAPVAAAAPSPAAPSPAPSTPAVTAARFDADYLHNPKPVYPAFSRRAGEQGKVLLRVKVSAEGLAQDVDIKQSSGYPRLDGAAREAVVKWRFIPAKRGDEAIETWVTVPITFAIE